MSEIKDAGCYIVTGATGGMGSEVVRSLAATGRDVVMACRDLTKGEAIRQSVLSATPEASLKVMELDLSSMASVRKFSEAMAPGSVGALLNNAGTISKEYSLTNDGFENTLAVNYLAPWLLTVSLLGKMVPGAAVVNMVSLSCRFVRTLPEDLLSGGRKGYSQLGEYARSKRALLSFTLEFARRRPDLRVNMADPGVVATGILNLGRWFDPVTDALFKPFCKKPAEGAWPALTALAAESSSGYFTGKGRRPVPRQYLSPGSDALLWEATAKLFGC